MLQQLCRLLVVPTKTLHASCMHAWQVCVAACSCSMLRDAVAQPSLWRGMWQRDCASVARHFPEAEGMAPEVSGAHARTPPCVRRITTHDMRRTTATQTPESTTAAAAAAAKRAHPPHACAAAPPAHTTRAQPTRTASRRLKTVDMAQQPEELTVCPL
jgi:hypothetical protein